MRDPAKRRIYRDGTRTIPWHNIFVKTPSPKGAQAYFINLKNRATVTSPFKVQFGLSGMGVAPVGVNKENTGHHHVLIDTDVSGKALNEPIPR